MNTSKSTNLKCFQKLNFDFHCIRFSNVRSEDDPCVATIWRQRSKPRCFESPKRSTKMFLFACKRRGWLGLKYQRRSVKCCQFVWLTKKTMRRRKTHQSTWRTTTAGSTEVSLWKMDRILSSSKATLYFSNSFRHSTENSSSFKGRTLNGIFILTCSWLNSFLDSWNVKVSGGVMLNSRRTFSMHLCVWMCLNALTGPILSIFEL